MPHSSEPLPAEDVAAHLRATIAPLWRLLRQHSGERLTPTQSSVLGSIIRHGPISISDLAAREQLSMPVVSKAISALEGGDLVERIRLAADRRVCQIQVSEHGAEWVLESRARRDSWLAERLASLDPADLATVEAAMEVLQRVTADPAEATAPGPHADDWESQPQPGESSTGTPDRR